MNFAIKIVGAALTAAALFGMGIGTASAATADGNHNAAAADHTADTSTTTVVAYQGAVSTWQTKSLPSFACPIDTPWLVNMDLSPSRIVPHGVAVDEPGGIGVTIAKPTAGPGGMANGWTDGTATNWGTHTSMVTVSAVCTSSAAAAYLA